MKQTIKYAIIEDELILRNELRGLISQLRPDFELAFEAESVAETTIRFTQHPNINLAFMDIQLTDGIAFEVFEHTTVNCPVIFTTAYDEYALKAFSVFSVDYLLKPVTRSDLESALSKFEHITSMQPPQAADLMSKIASFVDSHRLPTRILIESGDSFGHVDISEIAYFVSDGGLIFAQLFNGMRKLTHFTNLAELSTSLNPDVFFKLTRSIMASVKSIKSVKRYFKGRLKVTISDEVNTVECIVPAERRNDFLSWLGQ